VEHRIGDLDSYYFMTFKNGLQCPIEEKSTNEELQFHIYVHKISGNSSKWVVYDSLKMK
jgi:hypothetical protein